MTQESEGRSIDKGGKSIIDQVADGLLEPNAGEERQVHSPTTSTGKPVAEQIHKKWDPKKRGGLPTFLKTRRSA